jgi:hypothetical protein
VIERVKGVIRILVAVQTTVILALVYFAFFAPVGIVQRVLHRGVLWRRIADRSGWIERPPAPPAPESYEWPF